MPRVRRVEEVAANRNDWVYLEAKGYVSIEAQNFNRAVSPAHIQWTVVPNLGRTASSVTTLPANVIPAANDKVYLEYDIYFETAGEFEVTALLSPTLAFNTSEGLRYAYFGAPGEHTPAIVAGQGGLRYAVSLSGGNENIVNFNLHFDARLLESWQATNINKTTSKLTVPAPGLHTLRFRVLNPGIVLQKILIDTGGLKPTYLGAPESKRVLKSSL